jgi:secondary thiamine-phosphate synthase enzyme
MKVYHNEFKLKTSKRTEVIDLTEKVEKELEKSKVENGICLIFLPHATAALILEEAENGLIKDIEKTVQKIFPRGMNYEHDKIDDNADSHLASGFIGQSKILPVKNGKLVRGVWQKPLLLELDGPRERKVFITIIGE